MTLALAILAVVAALTTCITSIINLRTSRRNRKSIQEVHILVNSKFQTAIDRVEQLTHTLEVAKVDVPPEP